MDFFEEVVKSSRRLEVRAKKGVVQWASGDFLENFEATWANADIVFACSTCFDEATMEGIARRAERLAPGARLVSLDKRLPSEAYRLAAVCQLHGSWGLAVAYIHIHERE